MRGRLLATIFLFAFTIGLFGQDYHSRSKKAIALYEQARDLDHAGNWYRSLDLLKQALAKDDDFDEAILLTHQIYIKRGDWYRADSLYNKLQAKVEDVFKNRMLLDGAYYNYAEGRYEAAARLKEQIDGDVKNIDHRVYELTRASIDYAVEMKKRARDISFSELDYPLNNHPQQYFPSITVNDMLVFTVRKKEGRGDENIFFSEFKEGEWTKPMSISANINTDRNEGTAAISADGRTLVFTGCNKPGGVGSCDLYVSYRGAEDWSRPQLLSEAVNSLYWESQPSLSQDGRQLYFVSKRPDGLGGQDIWWSKRIAGEWQPAINLGPVINTSFDDCSPYIHPNGQDLFFASRGRPGFGGYDLYRSLRKDEAEWTEPENLGYPINNHRNQVGYTIDRQGWAYFSDNASTRETKLYRFKMPADLLPDAPLYTLSGEVLDATNNQPLSAEVIVADIATDSILLKTRSTSSSGVYRLLMAPNDNANLYIKQKGYLLYKSGMASLYANTNDTTIRLKPITVGDRVVLRNILFEFNSAALNSAATKELDLAAEFILENPEVKVEIAGHTDSQGDEEYNLKLSKNRAAAVFEYFLKKNIPESNLEFKGYGESQPVGKGTSDENDALNRRIELIITSIEAN